MRSPVDPKRSLRSSFFAIAILMGVATLSACGGGGGGGSVTLPPPPPPPVGTGITIYPGTTTVPLGGKATFTAFVPSATTTPTFTWAVTGTGNGSITTDGSGNGDYVAPTTAPAGTVSVTVTSTVNGVSLGGTATVTISAAAAGGVAVSPAAVAVAAGAPFQFSATLNGNPATVTQWQVNGVVGGDTVHGTISSLGDYTAPLVPPPGGSTTITAVTASGSATANATVTFSNSSFSGPYAFAYTGDDASGFLAVAGSLTAQSGTLTGEEDGSNGEEAFSPASISGIYSIRPDGRGTVTIAGSAVPGGAETWQIAISSNPSAYPGSPSQHVLLVRFDATGTGSGTLDHQNTIATAFPVGSYSFGLTGLTSAGAQLSAAGRFSSTGNGGTVTNSSVWDVNYAATPVTDDTTLEATFTPAPIGTSVGRGTMSLFSTNTTLNSLTGSTTTSTFSFIYYLVDSTHAKVIENDGHAFLTGDVFSGPTTPLGSFTAANTLKNGNYPFTVTGASTMGSYTAGGVFAYSASGSSSSTSTGVMDINNAGVVIPLDKTLTTTASVDVNLGRISFTFSPAGDTSGGYTFDGFATSTGSVELVETDTRASTFGVAYPQVATAEPSGSYAANTTGLVATNAGAEEQDIAGQLSVTSGTITGTLDINTGGTATPGLELLSGTALVATDANGRGTMTLEPSGSTLQLVYYVIDSRTVLLMGTDATHVLTGTMNGQF